MTLRRLSPEDWAAFRDIRLEMLLTEPEAFGSTHAEWAAKPEAEIMDWLQMIHAFGVFADDRRILSTAAWTPKRGQAVAHRGEVIAVYTRSEARGQGYLRRLMERIEGDAIAAGCLQLELDVSDTNAGAEAAYRALGYESIGQLPRALRHDGRFLGKITMVKALDG